MPAPVPPNRYWRYWLHWKRRSRGRRCASVRSASARWRVTVHALERPVWASLTTRLASLSEGNALARRFVPDVNLFASACDDSPAALAALAALVRPGESVFLLQVPKVVIPPGLVEVKTGEGVQMVATRSMV